MNVASAFCHVPTRLAVDRRMEGVCKDAPHRSDRESSCANAIWPRDGGMRSVLSLASSSRRSVPPLSRGCPPKTFQPGDSPRPPIGRSPETHAPPTIGRPRCQKKFVPTCHRPCSPEPPLLREPKFRLAETEVRTVKTTADPTSTANAKQKPMITSVLVFGVTGSSARIVASRSFPSGEVQKDGPAATLVQLGSCVHCLPLREVTA